MKTILPLFILLAWLLASCGKPATPTPAPASLPTATPTTQPTPIPVVILTYQEYAQVELVTPSGRHIYIDMLNPIKLTRPPEAQDLLLTTHLHADHYNRDFQKSFPGQQIFTSEGRIELPEVTITGIAASHNSDETAQADMRIINIIYIIDVAGLRIAHFGDIGQEALSADQLAALGTVDLAISQFTNDYSSMNVKNMKGFNLMDQVKPRLVIPTHADEDAIKIAVERWKGYYSESRTVTFSASSIPSERSILILGNLAPSYGVLYKLDPWKGP